MSNFKQKMLEELKAIGITALYFGCCIAALLLLKSLILAEYEIEFNKCSSVVIGALVLSKVVLILEHVSLGAWVRALPAWVDVVLRTAMYSLGVVVVLLLEKGFEARDEYGGFVAALQQLSQQTDIDHVWANTLCISGALLGYNILSVFTRYLGPGGLIKMLMSPMPEEPENNAA